MKNNGAPPPFRDPPLALAWSEDLANAGGLDRPALALWRPEGVYAALGLAQDPARELALDPDGRLGIPVVRRQSGGGAVLLYPGVLCWEALTPMDAIDAALGENAGIRGAYDFLSRPVTEGLGRLGVAAFRAGISDLSTTCPDGQIRKIAGTAQSRKRDTVLVHGALLVGADVAEMGKYLSFPSAQPDYRRDRSHRDFCVSIAQLPAAAGVDGETLMARVAEAVRAALATAGWTETDLPEALSGEAALLENEKYRNDDWNWRKIRPARVLWPH